ncbi:hypothetical protein [Gordonia sp. (in: high G+C Gram-positive bacteria)]|uniref:hypothetical protein n=1 Tax=Gordonia sp. (in: high G+C Gram-positive bacteria) TaxID=84139 RepID=UPI00333E8ED2
MNHALARTVETTTGIYTAGLAVRVVRQHGADVTIDLAPTGMPPRYLTIPAHMITTRRAPNLQGRTAECGTLDGVRQHRRNDEPSCPDCALVHADHQRARRVRRSQAHAITVPVEALAATITAADSETTAILADAVGPATIHAVSEYLALREPGCERTATTTVKHG